MDWKVAAASTSITAACRKNLVAKSMQLLELSEHPSRASSF
jgi:hypothetical protein